METTMSKIYSALIEVSKTRNLEKLEHHSNAFQAARKFVNSSAITLLEKGMLVLSQRIETLLPDINNKVIQFIGSRQGEGTSTVAREFARTLAFSIGKKVLLIDADRFHPSHRLSFGIQYEEGWQEIISSKHPVEDAIHCFECSNLFLCPSSNTTRSTPELFDTRVIDPFLNAIRQQFDFLIIDSTPITNSPDGLAIAPKADGVIIVVEAEKTKWTIIENLKQQIQNVGGNVLGIVFNKRNYHIPNFIYRFLG